MIPHRMHNNEIFGSGLKDRVTACRKRLRINRSVYKGHLDDQPVAFAVETSAGFLDVYPAVRESSVNSGESSHFQMEKRGNPETKRLA